jgi:hypothetical protein
MFLKSQSNSLYTAISEQGLNQHEFVLTNKNELVVTHIQSEYRFRINSYEVSVGTGNTKETRLQILFTPNFKAAIPTKGESQLSAIKSWADLLGFFNQWVTWLKSEVEEPDLWAEMEHTPHLFSDEEPATDEHFTPAEIKLLEERVAEVEQRVLELNLPPEAEAAVVETVRAVPAKATRFTKKELADCIVGSLVKEGFKWGLTTEHMSAAWHACQHFFTLLLPG